MNFITVLPSGTIPLGHALVQKSCNSYCFVEARATTYFCYSLKWYFIDCGTWNGSFKKSSICRENNLRIPRSCSDIKCNSSNNTYLNIIKLLLCIFFQFKDHRVGKFSNNIDLWKLDFLSEEKISECSLFVNKVKVCCILLFCWIERWRFATPYMTTIQWSSNWKKIWKIYNSTIFK